ncbi:hypothetical protein CPB85DRAFT_1250885 [Mucidula mucida]|nr:hypothetical protein CPB85DRAFT_1250885 [Mucidula mucida]
MAFEFYGGKTYNVSSLQVRKVNSGNPGNNGPTDEEAGNSIPLDPLEYLMGYSRGEMDALFKTEKSFNMTELVKKYGWGIMHTQEELERILAFFRANSEAGVKNRVSYTTRSPLDWNAHLLPHLAIMVPESPEVADATS